ncbi:MAG: hypothetical protein MUC98_18470 [Desulfobacterota bacterium]|nr:hypothetical protein [Thermodesulfobacteriota bacterium]
MTRSLIPADPPEADKSRNPGIDNLFWTPATLSRRKPGAGVTILYETDV